MSDTLQQIQSLQFTQRPAAEALLLEFITETFDLNVTAVELRPLAVSLNSFNGFLTLQDGRRLFFKTHTEPDNIIGEYYNASQLSNAGYPVIQPIMSSTEAGKQILIYEVVSDPSVFDTAWSIEMGDAQHEKMLTEAQHEADGQLREIYFRTLRQQSAEDAGNSPIHQLFYHRLTGGRLQRFYSPETTIKLPTKTYSTGEVLQKRWQINGQLYNETLAEIIDRAIRMLLPAQAGISVIGHGDAHNGNVFLHLEDAKANLIYFDPAFAGQHHPLLDLTKPLFHNVFAMWMYYPDIKAAQTKIQLHEEEDMWQVEYDYPLHSIRHMLLESKISRVLIPILQELQLQNQLRDDWRAFLKSALFCCPFLTMNLADDVKFPSEICLLGLAMAVEMGSESNGTKSLIDQKLDEVEYALR